VLAAQGEAIEVAADEGFAPAYLPSARRRSWRRRAGSSVDRLFAN
jgi:hypothetical protein